MLLTDDYKESSMNDGSFGMSSLSSPSQFIYTNRFMGRRSVPYFTHISKKPVPFSKTKIWWVCYRLPKVWTIHIAASWVVVLQSLWCSDFTTFSPNAAISCDAGMPIHSQSLIPLSDKECNHFKCRMSNCTSEEVYRLFDIKWYV